MSKQKVTPTWLYHEKHGSRLFQLTEEKAEALEEEGWKDSPAGFKKKPAKEKKEEKTELELTAEQEGFLQVFLVEPEKLDKDELIDLGKGFGVHLMPNWKEKTMINKIQQALDDNG